MREPGPPTGDQTKRRDRTGLDFDDLAAPESCKLPSFDFLQKRFVLI
jgi:hypothetical protein